MSGVSVRPADHAATHERARRVLNDAASGRVRPYATTPLAFVAERNGDAVGWLSADMLYEWLYISRLGVAEAARGAGVGTALMAACEAAAQSAGAIGATVDTFGYQAAPFYEKLGYREDRRLPHPDSAYVRLYFTKMF